MVNLKKNMEDYQLIFNFCTKKDYLIKNKKYLEKSFVLQSNSLFNNSPFSPFFIHLKKTSIPKDVVSFRDVVA